MLTEIDAFLESVVTEACSLLQLTDPNTNDTIITDTRVITCSRLAYTQITSYLNRGLLRKFRAEDYFEEDTTINLRCIPVSSIDDIVSVSISDTRYFEVLTDPDAFTELDPLTDFRLKGTNCLVIYNLEKIAEIVGSLTQRINVHVEYTSGYSSTDEVPEIHNALVTQTVANYNRIPALGLTQIEGGGETKGGRVLMNLNLVDAGQLLEAVCVSLSPYVYYGSGELVDGVEAPT